MFPCHSEDNFLWSVLRFHHMAYRDEAQVTRFGGKHHLPIENIYQVCICYIFETQYHCVA